MNDEGHLQQWFSNYIMSSLWNSLKIRGGVEEGCNDGQGSRKN